MPWRDLSEGVNQLRAISQGESTLFKQSRVRTKAWLKCLERTSNLSREFESLRARHLLTKPRTGACPVWRPAVTAASVAFSPTILILSSPTSIFEVTDCRKAFLACVSPELSFSRMSREKAASRSGVIIASAH